jgi:hypothetical protein
MNATLEPFDESVYDAARAICAERAILGGSRAFDDSATFATARGIRARLEASRRDARVTGQGVAAALRRLQDAGLVARVPLERVYKTRPPRPRPHAGYVVLAQRQGGTTNEVRQYFNKLGYIPLRDGPDATFGADLRMLVS